MDLHQFIKTHGHMSAAKKDVQHTSVWLCVKTYGHVSAAKKNMCDTQVCYLQEPLSHHFQPLAFL